MTHTAMPDFRSIDTDDGPGVTYTCGCPCTPIATPGTNGAAAYEHCCCGRVHFAGANAEQSLTTYLAERKARRRREPDYDRGAGAIDLDGDTVEVAWAFPKV